MTTPARRTSTRIVPEPDPIPDEPPPAYEPTPSTYAHEQTLEYGPLRPFQAPPTQNLFAPPSHPPPPPVHPSLSHLNPPQRRQSRSQHRYQPSNAPLREPDRPYQPPPPQAALPPPTFPFWNGSSLTPAQTGFQEGPALAQFGTLPPTQSQPPPQNRPPPPSRSTTTSYAPTTSPTPGQPLLNDGQLLVYPVGKEVCYKCHNTGYKPFNEYTSGGYKGDDPSHPCRKCWQKFGKPYNSILRHSHSTSPQPPPNYQKPLRLVSSPSSQSYPPPPPGQGGPRGPIIFTNQRPHVNVLGNSLVVRPGDPRIGGVLCRTCGGDGLMMGPFIFDEVTCNRCFGTGRVF
ncbi:hypothetical protein JCM16303_002086 [Sporobolomyces ruberrimus]